MRIVSQAIYVTLALLIIAGIPDCALCHAKSQAQSHCSVESKTQYYSDFKASYEGVRRDQAKALEAARKYLACAVDPSDHEEIPAKLNLAVGRMLSAESLFNEAIPYFIKAVSYNSTVKTSTQTYADLAKAYEEGPYARLADEYRMNFEGKDETQQSLLALENIYLIVDRIIDAYARSVALAGVELPKRTKGRGLRVFTGRDPAESADTLIGFYQFRHSGSDAGLKKLIGTILAQGVPAEPTSITSPPLKK